MSETHSITFGSETILFDVRFSRRKSLAINVFPGGEVKLVAPKSTTIEKIKEKVQKKAAWILRQKWHFAAFNAIFPKRHYISGETHRYLGKQYRLKIIEADRNNAKLIGGYLIVNTREKANSKRTKLILESWYREHAKVRFPLILANSYKHLQKIGIPNPVLEIKTMEKRWGSCTSAGKMTLNLELIKAPLPCIEYVIIHELCHLKQHHHGKEFFDILSRVMPDWEKRKLRLEKLMSEV
jgi:predicted metal-dependent hydrolase